MTSPADTPKAVNTAKPDAPELITLSSESIGGHGAHWQLLSHQPDQEVPQWLQESLNQAESPLGLNEDESTLPQHLWLIQGLQSAVQVSQIIAVDAQTQRPTQLISAFPTVKSPYLTQAFIKRIAHCPNSHQAILNLQTINGANVYAFDNLFSINQHQYIADKIYNIALGGFAYELEKVTDDDTLIVDDPAAIHHHRALNDILANNDGVAPENLQEQIADWQAKTEEDKLPVTLSLSKMIAYLFGETFGQEDEAWFQGEILGVSSTEFMGKTIQLLDVVIIREQDIKPVVIRLAYLDQSEQSIIFNVGEYIRGNIWIQASIYVTNNG
jgi:hypothetical protein